MSFVRCYELIAGPGKAVELVAVLQEMSAILATAPGSLNRQILHDQAAPDEFMFIETWASSADQQAGGSALGKEIFGRMMAALAQKPKARSFSRL